MRNTLFTIIMGIIIIVGIVVIVNNAPDNVSVTKQDDSTHDEITKPESLSVEDNVLTYHPDHIRMDISLDWSLVDPKDISFPSSLSNDVQFALAHEAGECVIAYTYIPREFNEEYEQVSFATRVFDKERNQYDGGWYVPAESVSENFSFDWEGRQPLDHEVRIQRGMYSYNPEIKGRLNRLILFNETGARVPDGCDEDMNKLLNSTELIFLTKDTLDENDQGELFITRFPDSTRMMFRSVDSQIAYQFIDFNNLKPQPEVTVFDNSVFLAIDNRLTRLNVFTKEFNDLVDTSDTDKVVNEFYPYDDSLYLLMGENRNDYLSECSNSLYQSDLSGSSRELLATDVPYRNIAGYDGTENQLAMLWSDGDAGCFWVETGSYSFVSETVQSEFELTICSQDDDYDSQRARYNSFLEPFSAQNQEARSIQVSVGRLSISTTTSQVSSGRRILFIGSD